MGRLSGRVALVTGAVVPVDGGLTAGLAKMRIDLQGLQ
jgi:hypothetical protein